MTITDVHTEHCCIRHGCKYGDDDCTVAAGKLKQSYECESCVMDREEIEHMDIPYLFSNLLAEQKEHLLNLLTQKPDRVPDKIVRNCAAYFLSRSGSTVYYKLHASDHFTWDMPTAEWDALPNIN